jgi:hypothetical protein
MNILLLLVWNLTNTWPFIVSWPYPILKQSCSNWQDLKFKYSFQIFVFKIQQKKVCVGWIIVNESLIIKWISDSLWPPSSLLSQSSSPPSLSPSYCPVSVLSHLLKAFHGRGYVFKLNRLVIQFHWFCSIYWIPTEFYSNFDFARGSVAADVWAFGTTLWEIFAYGECPPETSNVDSIKKVTVHNFLIN